MEEGGEGGRRENKGREEGREEKVGRMDEERE